MVGALPNKEADNVINLRVIDGKITKKDKVKYNKDGTISKRKCNSVAGKSKMVYPFYEDEIRDLIALFNRRIEEADTSNHRQIACRNKMLFIIGINSSLRVSDLANLKWNFFLNSDGTFKNYDKLQPKKTRKTGKFMTFYFNGAVRKIITWYMNEYPIEDMDDYLFKSRKGDKHLTEIAIGKIIKDAANEVGIDKNICSHSLRKSFGYHVWHNASDKERALVELMVILRHSSVAITKQYIGIMDEEIESVFHDLNLGMEYL